jgi:hypothetical protein
LPKAVGELFFSIGNYLSTSSVRQYSIFFTLVSSSSLYFKIFLSSAMKIFSVSKETC